MIQNSNSKPSSREARYAVLLDIAEAVFLEKGYETATVNDILEAAQLSKGGFYHYFASKLEVLEALRSRYTAWFLETIESNVTSLAPDAMHDRFCAWVQTYAEAYVKTYAVHDLVYHSVHSARASEDRAVITKSIETLVQQGVDQGTWRVDSSVPLVATIIYSAIHGVADESISGYHEDLLNVTETLCKTLLRMLNVELHT